MADRYPEIYETIGCIHRHLHEPLSLSELARYAAYSPYHFTRIFKEKMGHLSCLLYFSITSSKGKGFVVEYKSVRTGYRAGNRSKEFRDIYNSIYDIWQKNAPYFNEGMNFARFY
jgi:AraC-like DNA-binding protein